MYIIHKYVQEKIQNPFKELNINVYYAKNKAVNPAVKAGEPVSLPPEKAEVVKKAHNAEKNAPPPTKTIAMVKNACEKKKNT